MANRKVQVAVEGNIGCGKTTFLQYFQSLSPDIEILPEPIDKWRDVRGFNLFESFYNNPAKFNTPFRAQIMATLGDQISAPRTKPVRIIERSIHSNRFCFIEAIRQNGIVPDGDYELMNRYYEWTCKLPIFKLDLIVYLRSTPEVCAERIKRRQRKGEDGIPIEYLRQLHDLHEKWLMGENSHLLPAPVVVIECDGPLTEVQSTYFKKRDEILCGIKV